MVISKINLFYLKKNYYGVVWLDLIDRIVEIYKLINWFIYFVWLNTTWSIHIKHITLLLKQKHWLLPSCRENKAPAIIQSKWRSWEEVRESNLRCCLKVSILHVFRGELSTPLCPIQKKKKLKINSQQWRGRWWKEGGDCLDSSGWRRGKTK